MTFKLYITSTSCGVANYIVATLADLSFDYEQIDFATKKTTSGADFMAINPKGNVPAIVFEDGTVLNENVATLTYLADQNPNAGLAPQSGMDRYKFLNNLGYVNSELHPAFGILFNPTLDDAARKAAVDRALIKVKTFTDVILGEKKYLSGGDKPDACDIYAGIILSWAYYHKVDLSGNKAITDYFGRTFGYAPVKEIYDKLNA